MAYPSARDLEFDFKTTGAEDAIHAIADYYGVPCVSLRGALFSELKANSSTYPIKQIYHDRHHPSAWGHSLLAQMVVTQMEKAIDHARSTTGHHAGTGTAALEPGGACAVAQAEMRGIGPSGVPTAARPGPHLRALLYSRRSY